MHIRKATLQDAEAIARVHVESWKTTYKGIIPDDFLNNLSYTQRTDLWTQAITQQDHYIMVAETSEGEIVGFADGWKKETNTVPHSGDLTSIYILESYQGKGMGKQLLQALFEIFKQLGWQKVFVEVLEDNKTCDWYEYYSATLCKTVTIQIGGVLLNERIYEWNNIDDVLARSSK